nr:hypothetical protein [Tanacetum cinerariifolium]
MRSRVDHGSSLRLLQVVGLEPRSSVTRWRFQKIEKEEKMETFLASFFCCGLHDSFGCRFLVQAKCKPLKPMIDLGLHLNVYVFKSQFSFPKLDKQIIILCCGIAGSPLEKRKPPPALVRLCPGIIGKHLEDVFDGLEVLTSFSPDIKEDGSIMKKERVIEMIDDLYF